MLICLYNMPLVCRSDLMTSLEERLYVKKEGRSEHLLPTCKQSHWARMTKMQLASQKLIHTTSTLEFHVHLHLPMEPKRLYHCVQEYYMWMHAQVCTWVILAQTN